MKNAIDCCQTERQIQRDACGSVHTARVTQQCLHANCLQMIQKKQWPPNSSNLNHLHERCTKHFWKLLSKSVTVSELKVALEKRGENFRRQSSPEFLPARRSKRGIYYGDVAGWLAEWLGVCLSVTRRYRIKTAKPILKLLIPSGSNIILVSSDPCADNQFQGEPLQRWR